MLRAPTQRRHKGVAHRKGQASILGFKDGGIGTKPFCVVLVAFLGVGAGCAAPASTTATDTGGVVDGRVHYWNGTELRGEDPAVPSAADEVLLCLAAGVCPSAQAPCGAENCARHELRVADDADAQKIVAGLRWRTVDPAWFALWIEDADGNVVAEGRSMTADHNGASAILESPHAGTYQIVVAAKYGASTYELAARLVGRTAAPSGDLLPDIVTLPPTDLRFEDPPGQFVMNLIALPTNGVADAMGAHHCSADEASNGARLCLRFTNAVANLGDGPLDIALTPTEGATAPVGGRFVQRIHAGDGSFREVEAGPAEFHAIHGHWHNAGANAFQVYTYDAATMVRGAAVAEGRKTGMCFADVGVADTAWPGLALPSHGAIQCFNPTISGEWNMGLAPGWYDSYTWILNDQYVDLAGLPDGTYLLCSLANAAGFLVELGTSNNEGCTAFRLHGETVETLDPRPYHAEPN